MRRDRFEEVGGFDEGLPLTLNDVDLCRRVRERAGWSSSRRVPGCFTTKG